MRNNLLAGTAIPISIPMSALERRMGRHMRGPGEEDSGGGGGGGDSTATGNNGGGNSGDSSTGGDKSGDNAGQEDQFDQFWKEPKVEDEPAPKSGTGESTTQPDKTGEDKGDIGTQFATRLEKMGFGDPVFSESVANDIADGKLDSVNQALSRHGRETVKQAVMMAAELMGRYGEALNLKFERLLEGRFGAKENEQTLLEAFPSARDPKSRPLIESVFAQALKHTGGDRPKAITMARDMLMAFGKTSKDDLGLTTPPSDSEDMVLDEGPSNLVEELLGRT